MTGGLAALSHKALANIPEIQTHNEPTTAQPVVDESCEVNYLPVTTLNGWTLEPRCRDAVSYTHLTLPTT